MGSSLGCKVHTQLEVVEIPYMVRFMLHVGC